MGLEGDIELCSWLSEALEEQTARSLPRQKAGGKVIPSLFPRGEHKRHLYRSKIRPRRAQDLC